MNVIKTAIEGMVILEPWIFEDSRDYFFESFHQREFDNKVASVLGHAINFVQDNESNSSYGVMRGLHFQRPIYIITRMVKGDTNYVAMLPCYYVAQKHEDELKVKIRNYVQPR